MQSRVFDIDGHLTIPPTDWHPSLTAAGLRNPAVKGPAQYWLKVEGSFTRALQKQCRQSFHVEVRREGYATPTQDEASRLGIPHRQRAWIREVSLCGDNRPWVLARTIIPLNCLEGEGRRLLHLGNRPLGAYLFTSPHWQRGPLETGLCKPEIPGQPELARRSLFSGQSSSLLVGEYLLPALFQRNAL
ncbi:chorismate--pyruvate lyase family protein [Marinobacter sp. F3R08]|uniref:chorismate--pyruvate lyase family protein n=1 Tax=Marinobacter sp. F3R08 TaxID=2841559 RepID=UPI001C09DE0B|nr:chorismate lyase [Marinobacter sp. F3R08]MBU2953212.1 chorismate lyase [Marinobacter sp. F3R08]